MTDPIGINLLPASGEWVYDPLPHRAKRVGDPAFQPQNLYFAPGGTKTDYSHAIDQLQAAYPGCRTVSLVCAWFGSALDVTQCAIYPSTTFIGGASEALANGSWVSAPWHCSGLTQSSPGLRPLSQSGGSFVYGGTPSDCAVVRCLRDLKARGFRTVFYPFLLMDCPGYPWRGRIGFGERDVSAAASAAVQAFLGTAAPPQFVRDTTNLTVGYSGATVDWTYRRMILHYANLCVLAGGVDLFLIGSELRGLETIRGPAWTKAGTPQSDGTATWDYPFVGGLSKLATDVRGVFDAAGLAKDQAGLHNLIAYSADWSNWMGYQHPGADGQWPHLDQLYASPDIDLVAFDNYLPLSDWTSDDGGLDAADWSSPKPAVWPPTSATMNGLGLAPPPRLASKDYLKANIEGGERYGWFYRNSDNLGRGPDPAGSALQVSRPVGDRAVQTRTPYQAGQETLAPKMLRWWWNNPHRAVYDSGDGQGWVPHGPPTRWVPQSKPITFAEYGFPTCDRCTNQPNVFFDPKSSESLTPYWSAWELVEGGSYRPERDDGLAAIACEAIVEYWTADGNNVIGAAGRKMIEPAFMCAWNWDARPFPVFPQSDVWGDGPNWRAGTWIGGKGAAIQLPAVNGGASIVAGTLFPSLVGQGWSVAYRPVAKTQVALHASGRETRRAGTTAPLWEIRMSFEVLTDVVRQDVQAIAGLYGAVAGARAPVFVETPPELGLEGGADFGRASIVARHTVEDGLASEAAGTTSDYGLASEASRLVPFRFADDDLEVEAFMTNLFAIKALTLRMVR